MKAQLPALLLDYRIKPKNHKDKTTNQPTNLSSTSVFTFLTTSSGANQTDYVEYFFLPRGQDTTNQ